MRQSLIGWPRTIEIDCKEGTWRGDKVTVGREDLVIIAWISLKHQHQHQHILSQIALECPYNTSVFDLHKSQGTRSNSCTSIPLHAHRTIELGSTAKESETESLHLLIHRLIGWANLGRASFSFHIISWMDDAGTNASISRAHQAHELCKATLNQHNQNTMPWKVSKIESG
jgi:hypothetical protein